MTTKRISSKPCPSNLQPALRSASKRRGTVATSPKAKRQKNGGSAKERSSNGSKADQARAALPSLPSKASSPKPRWSPSGKLCRDFRKQDIQDLWEIDRGARHDKQSPGAKAKAVVIGRISGALETIQGSRIPALERAAKANKAQFLMELFNKKVLCDELQLSPALYDALNIVAAWESWTFGEMVRLTLISLLESEYGEMLGTMGNILRSERERAWAMKHERPLGRLMKQLGWNGTTIASEEEAT